MVITHLVRNSYIVYICICIYPNHKILERIMNERLLVLYDVVDSIMYIHTYSSSFTPFWLIMAVSFITYRKGTPPT